MIKKIVWALLVGIILSIVLLERDQWLHKQAEVWFKNYYQTTTDSLMHGEIDTLTLFSPSLSLKNVVVTPRNNAPWHWQAKKLKVSFSWLKLAVYGSAALEVEIYDGSIVSSRIGSSFAIHEHINRLVTGSITAFPSYLDYITFLRTTFHLPAQDTIPAFTIQADVHARNMHSCMRLRTAIRAGYIGNSPHPLLTDLQGTFHGNIQTNDTAYTIALEGACSAYASFLPLHKNKLTLRGVWDNNHGSCTLTNNDRSVIVDHLSITLEKGQATLQGEGSCALGCFTPLVGMPTLGGTVAATMHGTTSGSFLDFQTTITGQHITYGNTELFPLVTGTLNKKEYTITGILSCILANNLTAQGSVIYNTNEETGTIQMQTTSPYTLAYLDPWKIKAGDAHGTITKKADGTIICTLGSHIHHPYTDEYCPLSATLCMQSNSITSAGNLGSLSYTAELARSPDWRLRSCYMYDEHKNVVGTAISSPDGAPKATATIGVPLIRKISKLFSHYDFHGNGTIVIDVTYGASTTTALAKLVKGTIRLPHVYNFIHAFSATLVHDHQDRSIHIKDLVCGLHKGILTSHHALCIYTPSYQLASWYVPCTLNSCLINYSNNLCALLSGQITLAGTTTTPPTLRGALLLERSQFKGNIFSESLTRSLFQQATQLLTPSKLDTHCNIHLETVVPAVIRTPFLETDAQVNVSIKNSLHDPALSGSITLLSGALLFPYRPLYITKGALHFAPHSSFAPLIELVAKNSLRSHSIALHATGSLTKPEIFLESAPPLTEEQIIALLLVGSEEESLATMMPTLIMNNISTLLFGDTKSQAALETYFKGALKPFKRVHLLPSFSDQSGRGGLRGALGIEVDDRWRALIQKNFSLSEDTRFEIEYQLSDDIRLRAIRDEHRDMGAEIEMRWKF